MNKNIAITLLIAAVGMALIAGCDVFTNPLIFDGSVTSGEVVINNNTSNFIGKSSVDLSGVLAKVTQSVDSVRFFNLTMMVDSLGSNTPDTTKISGAVNVDTSNGVLYHYNILTLANMPLSELSSERSIFDTTIAGFSFTPSGIDFLRQVLTESSPPVLYVSVQGSATHSPQQFTLRFKVYAQVYSKGK